MIVRTSLAAGLAALAFLALVSESPAKPPARPAPGGRVILGPGGFGGPGGRVVPMTTPTRTFAKTTLTTTTFARTPMPFKPGFVKPPLGKGNVTVKTAVYAGQFGVRTKGGFVAFKGKGHGHWSRKWYNARLRCWHWFCPSTGGWYYWCGGHGAYLPLRYLPVCAPTMMPLGAAAGELPPGAENVPEASADEVPAKSDNAAKNANAGKDETPLDVPEPE